MLSKALLLSKRPKMLSISDGDMDLGIWWPNRRTQWIIESALMFKTIGLKKKHNLYIFLSVIEWFFQLQIKEEKCFLNDFKAFFLLKSSEISFQVLISAKEGSNLCSFLLISGSTKERERLNYSAF